MTDRGLGADLDGEYVAGFELGRRWFDVERQPSEEDTAAALQQLVDGASPGIQVARLRGCQAGAFAAGWDLKLNHRQLLSRSRNVRVRPQWGPRVEKGLARMRSPLLPALAAVLTTPGLDLDSVAELQRQHITDRRERVEVVTSAGSQAVAPGSEVYVRAYLAWVDELGLGPEAPLWCIRVGAPRTRDSFRRLVMRLSVLTGEAFGRADDRRTSKRWQDRCGFMVMRLRP
jgi:hypothetical protein